MTFQVQIYWNDQKTERLKKMLSFFHSKVFKQGSLHQYTWLLMTKYTLSITNEEVAIFAENALRK